MLQRVRKLLIQKLGTGFWFPGLVAILRHIYETYSLGHLFKAWLKGSRDTRVPGASELYQLSWLVAAFCWLFAIKLPVDVLSITWVQYVGAAVAAYRILEILFFALYWVFVSQEERLIGVRRSLAGFMMNLLEISLFTSIVLILTDTAASAGSQWQIFYKNLSASFSLALAQSAESNFGCVVVHVQLITAGLILSIAVASLVGAVLRPEMDSPDANS